MTKLDQPWHSLSIKEVSGLLKTDPKSGLSSKKLGSALEKYGYNELPEKPPQSRIVRFLLQFNDFMTWILIAAVLISAFALKEMIDALVIAIIIVANAVLGFVQEGRAERAIAALQTMAAPSAYVIRDGKEMKIIARELVPGDLIILEAGSLVPADARIIESFNLRVNEATLTGESIPSQKIAKKIAKKTMLLDRKNMVYLGTTIATGRAMACVVATGSSTEMGKIAELVQTPGEKTTPLQVELHDVGRKIAIICLIVAAVVFGLGVLRGNPWQIMFLAGVSLAVAAIPEGLPAIVTITLAIGLERMAKKNAIVRRLLAVETLGTASAICTDKTGTLTRNEMRIGVIDVGNALFKREEGRLDWKKDPRVTRLLMIAALCNDARKGAEDIYIGDPTEIALLLGAEENNITKEKLNNVFPRVQEIPFNSERKMMTTINQIRKDIEQAVKIEDVPDSPYALVAYSKGAPEVIIDKCSQIFTGDSVERLTKAKKEELLARNEKLAGQAFRMLAFAYQPLGLPDDGQTVRDIDLDSVEEELIFVGLAGLNDPPRPEVYDALKVAKEAGLLVTMVTGDHHLTAEAIGRELSLLEDGRSAITSSRLKSISDEKLAEMAEDIAIYSRISAEDKIRIVKALRARGHIIAMTGDGVNDAPAIKQADIGISMGRIGADVTREASDMILTDDNFATIISAIREGRIIFDNLKKFLYFLLSCNISEVLIMFLVMLFSKYPPLWPVQILWINLVTDGLPALALGVDAPDPGIMTRKPRKRTERILSLNRQLDLLWQGLLMTMGALAVYLLSFYVLGKNLDGARTMLFVTLVFTQLFHVFNVRSEKQLPWSVGMLSNRYLLGALAISVLLQLSVIYIPAFQRVFHTQHINLNDWGIILLCSLIPVALIEVVKQMKVGWSTQQESRVDF